MKRGAWLFASTIGMAVASACGGDGGGSGEGGDDIDTYDLLVGPYTYSDMTGWGIQSATCGPQG